MPKLGQLPTDIPAGAFRTYADKGWKGMGDWLGTGTIAPRLRKFRPFLEARAFARKLKLKSGDEWRAFTQGRMPQLGRLPVDIPVNPNQTYADKGWKSMGDWLGTGNIGPGLKEYRPFREARAFASKLKLKSNIEWRIYCAGKMLRNGRLPEDIPSNPNLTYARKGWEGWGDWLGTGNIANSLKEYRSFRDARAYVHKLKLKSWVEWIAFTKGKMPELGQLPTDIPAVPYQTYADKGWKGMGDWLGTGNIANFLKKYRSFYEARAFARKLKLKKRDEWVAFSQGCMPKMGRLPADIPAAPQQTFANKGWKGYGDWLGTGRTRRAKR